MGATIGVVARTIKVRGEEIEGGLTGRNRWKESAHSPDLACS